jgi:hypothetical protein
MKTKSAARARKMQSICRQMVNRQKAQIENENKETILQSTHHQ